MAAETIVTNDGTRISGEIVGFENGYYQIQIGRFIKRVAESNVRQIIDAAPVSAAATGSIPLLTATPDISPVVSNPSGTIEGTDAPGAVLEKLKAGNPALMKYMEMQKSNGVSSEAMMNQVKQMQGNPIMLQMMSKFKDPAFQKNFLDNISKMKEAMNPNKDGSSNTEDTAREQNVEMLKGLFQQLNNAKPPGQ